MVGTVIFFHKSLHKWIMNRNIKAMFNNKNSYIIIFEHTAKYISINDLVTNWEKDEVSFIEALCKEDNSLSSYRRQDLQWKIVRKLWDTFEDGEPRPTSQRLEWLFNTFSHLLNQEQ